MATSTETQQAPAMLLEAFNQEEFKAQTNCRLIQPAFSQNNVAVCMVSSNEYAPFASVVVQSIIDNTTDANNYDIIILSDDMLLENQWRICKQGAKLANISIRVIDISEIVAGFTFYTWAHFTCKTYYRLLTPDLFQQFEKVIYLDSDIVVNHDIAELYHTKMDGYLLAAAYDSHVVAYCSQNPPLAQRAYNMKTLKLKDPALYFQAGVSLFNISAFRSEFEPGYLINNATKVELTWLDQDLLNMLCQGRIKRIANKWNVMVANVVPYVDEYYLPEEQRKEYFEARQNPYIVHYVGRMMPCCTSTPDLYEYYWTYARRSPFYEILLQQMAEHASANDQNVALLREEVRQMREEIERMHALQMSELVLANKPTKLSLKHRIKRTLLPIFNTFFPIGSNRRIWVKRHYFLLRGWHV